ncbi:unnamed protein product [Oppiella nova]|uniref:Serine carboxypeptidase n=1 Tax=Oppiella nova TaxID=334625 RepID=A0A7R9M724_9ACAR|nr:unnamed protein product [Oppiella nova]CAG2171977.1 unnamed protein product [Oppiella nova]
MSQQSGVGLNVLYIYVQLLGEPKAPGVTLTLGAYTALGANLDEITSLPGLSQPIKFKQYSGYLNASKGRHHFYWFVESETDPENAPVVLWLTGGPGCSSLFAMMTENGPFSANEDGVTLSSREHAWNTVANMVFMESPVSTGYTIN